MRTSSLAGAFISSLLLATALTQVNAADMTTDRALNVQREPQNWILHHGNYQGHRFSLLKDINTVTNTILKLAYTVALSGLQPGGRYFHDLIRKARGLRRPPIGVPDGWGSVYAID